MFISKLSKIKLKSLILLICANVHRWTNDFDSTLMNTQWRQTTVKQRSYGAECIHRLVWLANTGLTHFMTLNPQSTLNNVGLLVLQQHWPCPCCTHVWDTFNQLMFYLCTTSGKVFRDLRPLLASQAWLKSQDNESLTHDRTYHWSSPTEGHWGS